MRCGRGGGVLLASGQQKHKDNEREMFHHGELGMVIADCGLWIAELGREWGVL